MTTYLFYIITHHNALRTRMRLARQNKPIGYLFWFERVIDIHLYFSFQDFRFAGSTNTAFTGKWEISALL